MKTLKEVNKEIEQIHACNYDKSKTPIKDKKANYKKLKVLNEVRLYLETNPREDFIKQMLSDSKRKLKNIQEGFLKWLPEKVDLVTVEKNTTN